MHQKHFDDEMIRNDKKMYGFLSSKLTNCADERIVLKTTFIAGTINVHLVTVFRSSGNLWEITPYCS